jgi:hypothetical protein
MVMDKGIGFNRNIKMEWLDAVAAFCTETNDGTVVRQRLEAVLAQDRTGKDAIRKSIDILLNIWLKNRESYPQLYQQAQALWQTTQEPSDRLWLHYGLTMLYYPFFRDCIIAIGQLSRYEETITNRIVIEKLIGEMGHLGSLERSAQRVIASLRDWGVLVEAQERFTYVPQYRHFQASHLHLEQWLLACALCAHPVDQLSFADLLHLPALFPFKFTVSIYDLRQATGFDVQRQGAGLDMVRVVIK